MIANTDALVYQTVAQTENAKCSSVWALNRSGANGVAKGVLHLPSVVEANGRGTVVSIPVTFVPLDLTTLATKSALCMNPDFRRLVSNGLIGLISEEDAIRLRSTQAAQTEIRRLQNVNELQGVVETQQPAELQSMKQADAGSIGGLAMNIAHTEDGDEDAVVANLRNNIDALSAEELKYIVTNSPMHKVKILAAEYAVQ